MGQTSREDLNDTDLPTYDDVIREDQQRLNTGAQPPPPPARPPRRSDHNSPRPGGSSSSLSSSRPPPRINSTTGGSTTRPTKPIPWNYPRGFHCPKCGNTGYKLKNGKSCRSCWRRFAPVNDIHSQNTQVLQTPGYSSWGSSNWYSNPSNFASPWSMAPPRPPTMTTSTFAPPPGGSMAPMGNAPPLVVKPGDPRLGGVLCGECRGSGRVSFLFDEDLCPLCRGLGRIIR
ncbi:hypothetical protein ZYGR_0N03120 [Zygosaccharomyces rouxii]|uniref:ZYRO0D07458p n=2 Tax=Zygosaccharomyces rouxii TaxID=4956 RepID=C5DVK6_ZYGRC|nr:uncharacterized protein ZYRO0D07458g [Zygosaccharomyces rouxii]KAH9200737.1 hypothetical protein LQ764DRAFT_224225 [Zygosaccharomyces rouxii]GAV48907.1 hypothetical protein ZYGR_0N03120 [Zygosaccharomyces rouxii]CAR27825.1 ZYRO0D07458p [Zygosaccharomyces rouxii]